jgi:histidyl-tRNA synthetase
MTADSEALEVLTSILDKLPGIGDYKVKLNHRKLLDGMMQLCGVPADKLRPICSAIDKLDKESWEFVKDEMTKTKGLDEAVADRLGKYVKINGAPFDVLATLNAEPGFAEHALAGEALKELEVLFTYLQAVGRLDRINFDLSLARGLDYYTGVIYEAAQTGPSVSIESTCVRASGHQFMADASMLSLLRIFSIPLQTVGSIAAGGRYDNLVGMFSAKQVPAVGVSIGIERILNIVEQAVKKEQGTIRRTSTQVLVGSIGDGLYLQRKKLAAELRSLGIATDNLNDINPTYKKQTDFAKKHAIRYFIILDAEVIKTGQVKLKDRELEIEVLVPIEKAAKTLRKIIRLAASKEVDEAEGVEEAAVQALAKMQL